MLEKMQSNTHLNLHIMDGLLLNQHFIKFVRENMESLLKKYTVALTSAKTPEEKLLAIVDYIQSCEQLHPFIDCNCRTNCMSLLNHQLMQNGFPPVILTDPNRFGGYAKDELVLEVVNGMKMTLELISKGKLYNVDTKTLLKYITNHTYLNKKFGDYFTQCCTIEDTYRSSLKNKAKP